MLRMWCGASFSYIGAGTTRPPCDKNQRWQSVHRQRRRPVRGIRCGSATDLELTERWPGYSPVLWHRDGFRCRHDPGRHPGQWCQQSTGKLTWYHGDDGDSGFALIDQINSKIMFTENDGLSFPQSIPAPETWAPSAISVRLRWRTQSSSSLRSPPTREIPTACCWGPTGSGKPAILIGVDVA